MNADPILLGVLVILLVVAFAALAVKLGLGL
jgi:hypothetical protein